MQYKDDYINYKIIEYIQGDISLEPRPFKQLADTLNISESEIVQRIKKMQDNGIIRRFGAVLRHQKAGFTVNAMVVWKVDESLADLIGQTMAKYKEVSHCYLRHVDIDFGYNVFSMIHARNEQELEVIIKKISKETGLNQFSIIRSVKELKKVSMKYI